MEEGREDEMEGEGGRVRENDKEGWRERVRKERRRKI